VREVGALAQPGARDTEILVENFDLLASPPQLCGSIREPVLALSRFPIVFDLRRGGLTHINQGKPPQMGGGNFRIITHICAPVQRARR
jgi:hypothetical protein